MVQLMSSSLEALKIDGTAPDKAAGVISTTIKSDRIELVLGSGHYDISTPDLKSQR